MIAEYIGIRDVCRDQMTAALSLDVFRLRSDAEKRTLRYFLKLKFTSLVFPFIYNPNRTVKGLRHYYKIIIDDPRAVAQEIKSGLDDDLEFRRKHRDAFYFNWRLKIDQEFQMPFVATH